MRWLKVIVSIITSALLTDVMLQLPGGDIDAHKMILATVSPVWEDDFKNGKSNELTLPSDSWHIMKILIDYNYIVTMVNVRCVILVSLSLLYFSFYLLFLLEFPMNYSYFIPMLSPIIPVIFFKFLLCQ